MDTLNIAHARIGIAGAARPDVAEKMRLIAEVVGGKILVAGDMEITLHAAFAGRRGDHRDRRHRLHFVWVAMLKARPLVPVAGGSPSPTKVPVTG